MTFTIEQLEALKEGTTPGPWKFREHSDYEYPAGPEWGPMQTELEHAVLDAEDNHLFGAYNNYKMIEHPGNVPLAAVAPDLVDALIAAETKLKQLKEQIENLADWHDVKASKARVYPHPQEKERFIGKAEAHETARNKLTQILEGSDD